MEYSRIAKNARLGDGSLRVEPSSKNAHIAFVSTDKDVLTFKKSLCDKEGLSHSDFKTQKSGYGGTKTIYNFRVRTNEKLTEVYKLPIENLLNNLDREDIFLWLIDDGSWHKAQNLYHLYCNMLNDAETELLANQIKKLFGVKPRLRKDRKRDGRAFNYLYFPRQLTLIVRPKFKKYLEDNKLTSMMYKVGGSDYVDKLESLSEETILSDCYLTVVKKYAHARIYDKDPVIDEVDDKVRVTWLYKGEIKERIILKEAV